MIYINISVVHSFYKVFVILEIMVALISCSLANATLKAVDNNGLIVISSLLAVAWPEWGMGCGDDGYHPKQQLQELVMLAGYSLYGGWMSGVSFRKIQMRGRLLKSCDTSTDRMADRQNRLLKTAIQLGSIGVSERLQMVSDVSSHPPSAYHETWLETSQTVCQYLWFAWASCQIRKIAGFACAGNAGDVFPATTGYKSRAVMHTGIAK